MNTSRNTLRKTLRTSGMSLLEVLIAMMILSAGLILISTSWSGTFARLKKTQQTLEIAALLQRKMVEIEMEYKNKPLESIDDEKSDDFGSEFPQYSWKMQSKKFEMPDMTAMLIGRDGGANQMLLTIMKQFTDHLSKSVKEVKVTVIYTPKKAKPINYSLTTYFIDYDKEIALPPMGAGL